MVDPRVGNHLELEKAKLGREKPLRDKDLQSLNENPHRANYNCTRQGKRTEC